MSLAPFQNGQIRIAGPRLVLGARAVSTLTLALHELATNSLKYGALSSEQGSVTIAWSAETEDEPHIKFHWSEMGGPKVIEPKSRGFGSRVIEDTIKAEMQGAAQLEFHPAGVRYEIFAPLRALVDNVDAYSGRKSMKIDANQN